MPRIIPRLVQALRNAAITKEIEIACSTTPLSRPKQKTRSQWRPLPPPPSYSIEGRKKSFLLEPNPVVNKRLFRRHKTLPPVIRLGKYVKAGPGDVDKPRRMSVQERRWFSDPYLRMLGSHIRLCEYTDTHLPSDFMVRIGRVRLQTRSGRMMYAIIPDGLEHPKWRPRRSGFGWYIICRRQAFAQFMKKGSWHGTYGHAGLLDQITHLLRIRVLQEIAWLAEQARLRPRGALDKPILRRLTRTEWNDFRNTGVVPYEGAAAIIVAPPVNKNPVSKRRPEPHDSPLPPPDEEPSLLKKTLKPLPPLSVLHPTSSSEPEDGTNLDITFTLPNPRVPLYNGLALMPSRAMRAALHQHLNHLLFVERRARWRQMAKLGSKSRKDVHEKIEEADRDQALSKADRKASHAYLLSSDAGTLLRADAVPLAIALWRLQMWEGAGWQEPWKIILPSVQRR